MYKCPRAGNYRQPVEKAFKWLGAKDTEEKDIREM